MSASFGLWRVQVAASFHGSCRLRRNCRVHSFLGSQHTAVDVQPSGDAETEPGRDGMSEVHKTGKGEWWQLHVRSAAEVMCATVMPSAECVGCHGPKTSAPNASPSECCKRVSSLGHALDRRGSPGTTASPRRVCACMLASRDLSSAQQIRRVCASAALAPCSPPVVAFHVASNAAHRE